MREGVTRSGRQIDPNQAAQIFRLATDRTTARHFALRIHRSDDGSATPKGLRFDALLPQP